MMKIDMRDFLSSYSGKKVYFITNPGNAGDAFITYSTYCLFDELNICYEIIDPNNDISISNEILFFSGGGNLVEGKYDHLYKKLKKYLNNNKCIILPHTIWGYKDLVQETHRNLIIICREKVSYELCILNGANKNNLFLSDDMAFYFPQNELSQFAIKGRGHGYCLRTDGESSKFVYVNEFNKDISLSWNGELWGNYLLSKYVTYSLASYLSQFDVIETDRLHISIFAAMLNKKVIMYPNDYYKNRAVFENSIIQKYQNVNFVNTSTDLLHSDYVMDLLKNAHLITD
ncbi:hypothetical protein GQ597_07915 [Gilliamella sp. Pra-s65]|nr:hypothetical protein [Gilliamella sp. Pra-s65]MWP46551.1 hypothetical protein [Gilliamella sp. Pas-s27]MWP73733.1 hypothetical protein [Gilliamella sp. Pra-s52]